MKVISSILPSSRRSSNLTSTNEKTMNHENYSIDEIKQNGTLNDSYRCSSYESINSNSAEELIQSIREKKKEQSNRDDIIEAESINKLYQNQKKTSNQSENLIESKSSQFLKIARSLTGSNDSSRSCNCARSQCLKLNCDCFANGEFCSNCNCLNCFNNLENANIRRETVRKVLERNPYAFQPKKYVDQKASNESNCETKDEISRKEIYDSSNFKSNYTSFKDLPRSQLRAEVKLIEFIDHYETSIENLKEFKKNEIFIKYNDNRIEVNAIRIEDFEDKVIVDKILLKTFQLPNNIDTWQMTSFFTQDKKLILIFPKLIHDFIASF